MKCSGSPFNVTVHLKTSNYCGYLTPLAIGLSGTVSTFGDAGVRTPKSNFALGDTLYAKLAIDATQATISDVSIDTVILQQTGQADVVLASAGSVLSQGAVVSLQLTNDFAIRTATLSFTIDATYFPLAAQTSSLATISVVGLVTFANTQSRRLLVLEGALSPSNKDETEAGFHTPMARSNKLHHLSQMAKTQTAGNSLALKQMKNVALAQGVDTTDAALLKVILRQEQAQPQRGESSLVQAGSEVSSSSASGVKGQSPFIVGPKGH